MKTLKCVMPKEFMGCEYDKTASRKFADFEVISEHGFNDTSRWPGGHKHVFYWVILSNGKAVGWNESPSHGWSFPMITLKETKASKETEEQRQLRNEETLAIIAEAAKRAGEESVQRMKEKLGID
jgi:hypothetical protein